MSKPVLAAVDDSPRAAGVLDAAITLCRTFKSPLVLCRVIALPTVQLTPDGLPLGIDLQTELQESARRALDQIAQRVPPDVTTRLITIVDVPWQGICEAATKEGAGLILIGSHAYGGLDVILGTTAAKVVNHAEISVLVVRGDFPA